MNTHKLFSGLIIFALLLLPTLLTGNSAPTQAAPESARVSTELNTPIIVETVGVELSPGYNQTANPGSIVTYTHTLTNTGTNTDAFALDVSSSQGWPVSLSGASGTLSLPLQLDAGLTTTLLVSLTVPTAAISGTVDTAVITATSQTDLGVSAIATDAATVKNVTRYIYLPLILKHWPPVPDVPTLNTITDYGGGNYAVSWTSANLADSYVLQEATSSSFASPTQVYYGASTLWSATSKAGGTYYYRVKAHNSYGDSGWSNVQSIAVAQGPTPGFWQSTANTAHEFYVTADRAHVQNYALYITVSGCGSYKITNLNLVSISNNSFAFSGSFYASGIFSSQTAGRISDGLTNYYIGGCGYITGGPFTRDVAWKSSLQSAAEPAQLSGQITVEPVPYSNEYGKATLIK